MKKKMMKNIFKIVFCLISFNSFSQETTEIKPTFRIDCAINQGFINNGKSAIGFNVGLLANDIGSLELGIQTNTQELLYNIIMLYKITNYLNSGFGFYVNDKEKTKYGYFLENQIRPYNGEDFGIFIFHRFHYREYSSVGFGMQFKF
jgi:hypothetical protein